MHAALARIKEDRRNLFRTAHLEAICRESGLAWCERVLDPATTILIFFLRILHRNSAISNLSRLAGVVFTPGAYCQARQRLPLAALRHLSWPLIHEGDLPPLLVNPLRPGRAEPRERKRRPKQYPPMNEPREKLRKKPLRGRKAAQLNRIRLIASSISWPANLQGDRASRAF